MRPDFACLEQRADEPWHADPRDRDPASEEQRQLAFLNRCRYVAPSLIVWAVPNAARRTRWEVAKAKREGMQAGALDLTIAWNHGVAFAEFKNGSEPPTPQQKDMLNSLYRAGHRCGVFRNADSLFAVLRHWGAPVLAVS